MGAVDAGRTARARGDVVAAGVAFKEALTWYLPGAGWRAEATQELWSLADERAAQQDWKGEVLALGQLGGGLRGAAGVLGVDGTLKGEVDARLSLALARWEAAEGGGQPATPERVAYFRRLLEHDERAGGWPGVLLVAGVVAVGLGGWWGTRGLGWGWVVVAGGLGLVVAGAAG
jgi:hypothetical protein